MNTVTDWLLGSEPWIEFRTRLDLLNEDKNSEPVLSAKARILEDPMIQSYLNDLLTFHHQIVSSHKNPLLPLHKLNFLVDIGLKTQDAPQIAQAVASIMSHCDASGVYQSMVNIPKHYGGTGEDTFGWALCDAPILLSCLQRLGIDYEKHLKTGTDYLATAARDNGFPCTVSPELGKFRGPGRKDDCCPYATLLMLKLFAGIPEYANSPIAKKAALSLLDLWENSLTRHPYMFYMGTDFRKLKAHTIWFDIVSICDCLTQFPWLLEDSRLKEIVNIILSKADSSGRYTAESIFMAYKGWEFGQKKVPSAWLTFIICRLEKRMSQGKI